MKYFEIKNSSNKKISPNRIKTFANNFYISLCWLITVHLVSTKRKHRIALANIN